MMVIGFAIMLRGTLCAAKYDESFEKQIKEGLTRTRNWKHKSNQFRVFLILGKFVFAPQTIMIQLDYNSAIIVAGNFQFAGRFQRLHVGHRIIRIYNANLTFGGCSAAAGGLALFDDYSCRPPFTQELFKQQGFQAYLLTHPKCLPIP